MDEEKNYPKTDFAFVDDVEHVNYKPHPFTVGTRHVAYASDHNGGMLTQDVVEKFPCAYRNCSLPYAAHTSDHVAFVKLTRDATNEEVGAWLKSLIPWTEERKIDGFGFIKTGFRIKPPVSPEGDVDGESVK